MKVISFMAVTRNGYFRAFLNAIVFSFIKAPAFFLFIMVLVMYGKGELSLGWINEGRRLNQNVPIGMVNTCLDDYTSFNESKYADVFPKHSNKYAVARHDFSEKPSVLCKPSIEPAVDYAKKLDRNIKSLYQLIAMFSFGIWWILTKGGKRIRHGQ